MARHGPAARLGGRGAPGLRRPRRGAGPGRRVDVAGAGAALPAKMVRRAALAVLRAERVRHAVLSVTFVSDARMRRLNARHLGRRGRTDVIAFPLTATAGPVAGDVYVAPGAARASAAAHSVPVREELLRLVIHGVLHVLGYDHPDGAGRERSAMWRRQEALLAAIRRGR